VSKTQQKLERLLRRNTPIMLDAVNEWFAWQVKQVREDFNNKFVKAKYSDFTDWEFIEEQGVKTIKPATLTIMESGGDAGVEQVSATGSFDVVNVKAVRAAEKIAGVAVTSITKETRKAISRYIAEAVKQGRSMQKVSMDLRFVVGLNDNQVIAVNNRRIALETGKQKLSAKEIDRRIATYERKLLRQRTRAIARTETATAQNTGYVQGLEQEGITEVEFSASPNACPECLALNGQIFSTTEGAGVIPVHPNCTCGFLPVIGGNGVDKPVIKSLAGNRRCRHISKGLKRCG